MAETLLGKAHMGLTVDQAELTRLMHELKIYGDAPGSSFFLVRTAQSLVRAKQHKVALDTINRAVERTPDLLPPYFIRADILISLNDLSGAERDLETIDQLLQKRGGFLEGDESQMQELAIRIMIEKKQFQHAKDKIDTSAFLPHKVHRRLSQILARAIGFAPGSASKQLASWSKEYLANGRLGGR
jgi:hypothetical protein